jgi:glycosyltransferase involved in cell wall biosynthesis
MAHGVEVWKKLDIMTGVGARFASELWCVSEFTARQLWRYNNLAGTPTFVLPNALEEDPPAAQPRETGPPTLLSVCRLDSSERYKGVDAALRAHALLLSEMPELRFHVVGEGTDIGRLEQIVSDLGTGDRVSFLGRLSSADLASEYARCTVFVLPSRKEGFGIVFLEAMAHSKPVVALRSGGTPEVVIEGQTGFLVEPDNLGGLYAALRRLLHSEELRARMGRDGRAMVDRFFTPGAFRERLDALVGSRAAPLQP